MKLTKLDILRLADQQAFEDWSRYNELWKDSNYTSDYYRELMEHCGEKFDTIHEMYEKELDKELNKQDALTSL